jgi:Tfp pilus assembly protein PilO
VRLLGTDKLQTWHVDVSGVCAAALLLAVAYFGLIGPTLDRRVRQEAEAAELREATDKGRQLQSARRTADERLAGVERAIAARRLPLEPTSKLNERLSRLTELAGRARVQVDTVEPATEHVTPMYTKVPIRLCGRGGYGDVVRFLADLRRQMPDNAVDEVTLVAQPSATSPTATFTVSLTWHAAPPPSPVARK